MIYHGLVTRHCPHTAVFRLRRVVLSNNNLSHLPPILLAEAIVRLKDVDLRSSFLSAEQVMTGFANEKMMFDQSLHQPWLKNITDLIRVCLTLKKSKSRWLHFSRFCCSQVHNRKIEVGHNLKVKFKNTSVRRIGWIPSQVSWKLLETARKCVRDVDF